MVSTPLLQIVPGLIAVTLMVFAPTALAQQQMEILGRGVVAVVQNHGKVFVSWRRLGTEPADTGFDVFRAIADGKPRS